MSTLWNRPSLTSDHDQYPSIYKWYLSSLFSYSYLIEISTEPHHHPTNLIIVSELRLICLPAKRKSEDLSVPIRINWPSSTQRPFSLGFSYRETSQTKEFLSRNVDSRYLCSRNKNSFCGYFHHDCCWRDKILSDQAHKLHGWGPCLNKGYSYCWTDACGQWLWKAVPFPVKYCCSI